MTMVLALKVPMRKRSVAALCAGLAMVCSGTVVLAAAPASAATIWYASPTAIGSGNCSDAADACTLPTALSDAQSGDIIDLAAGSYPPGSYGLTISTSVTLQPVTPNTAVTLEASGSAYPTVSVNSGVTATITGVTITGDLYNGGNLTVEGSTITGGNDTTGGGIGSYGTLTVEGSTITGNTASKSGGGIFDGSGTTTVVASTITGNTSQYGAIYNYGGTVYLAADIIAHNSGPDCGGSITDDGYNVDDDGSCGLSSANGSISSSSTVALGPLAENGGPTESILPLYPNSAIGLIPSSTSVMVNGQAVQLCPTTDQRGIGSLSGQACNAGSVQFGWPVAAAQSFTATENTQLSEPALTLMSGETDDNTGATAPAYPGWTAALATQATDGTAVVSPNGSFTYTPTSSTFTGTDSFTYTLTDNLGYTSGPATVTITVNPSFSISVNGGTTTQTAEYGTSTTTFSESGVPANTSGTLTFSANGTTALCEISTFSSTTESCSPDPDIDLAPSSTPYTVNASLSADNTTEPASNTVPLTVTPFAVSATIEGSQTYGSSKPQFSVETSNAPEGVLSGTPVCTEVNGGATKIGPALTAGGSYTIYAPSCSDLSVSPSADYALSYVGGPFTVTQAQTSLSLHGVPPGWVLVGTPVVYVATVSKGTIPGTLTGTVAFTENSTTIAGCGAVKPVLGLYACLTKFSAPGSYSIGATYEGDPDFTNSTGSLSQPVYQLPAITSANHYTATVNKSFSFPVSATGYPSPTLSETGALPKGVTFSSGVLSGTPAKTGTYPITIFATNAAGTAHQDFTLVVQM
ncbi:MAG TPA: Ig-like domain repeat protein [Acidimicrobiales bacterium]|nr:Ig-like domain repeat protein [Acidimicrobiales bacterium]HUB70402.1 Ig-like domain repeat protein [Acidimicrobiales bacterium]